MRTQGLVLLLVLSFLTACGGDTKVEPVAQSTNDDSGASVGITTDFLLGTWTSACVLDPARRDIYIQEFLTFDDEGNVNRETTSFLGHKGCEVDLYQQNLTGKFAFSASGQYSETRTKVSYIVHSDSGVRVVNGGLCNVKNWKMNDQREYTDLRRCGILPTTNMRLKGLKDQNSSTLSMRQCRPGNDRDCTIMNYTRNY